MSTEFSKNKLVKKKCSDFEIVHAIRQPQIRPEVPLVDFQAVTCTKKNEQSVALHLLWELQEPARCHHLSKQNEDEPTVEEASHMYETRHS